MPCYDNINGVLRQVSKIYDNGGGVLREVSKGYDNVNGALREYHTNNEPGNMLLSLHCYFNQGSYRRRTTYLYRVNGNSYNFVGSIDHGGDYNATHLCTVSQDGKLFLVCPCGMYVRGENKLYSINDNNTLSLLQTIDIGWATANPAIPSPDFKYLYAGTAKNSGKDRITVYTNTYELFGNNYSLINELAEYSTTNTLSTGCVSPQNSTLGCCSDILILNSNGYTFRFIQSNGIPEATSYAFPTEQARSALGFDSEKKYVYQSGLNGDDWGAFWLNLNNHSHTFTKFSSDGNANQRFDYICGPAGAFNNTVQMHTCCGERYRIVATKGHYLSITGNHYVYDTLEIFYANPTTNKFELVTTLNSLEIDSFMGFSKNGEYALFQTATAFNRIATKGLIMLKCDVKQHTWFVYATKLSFADCVINAGSLNVDYPAFNACREPGGFGEGYYGHALCVSDFGQVIIQRAEWVGSTETTYVERYKTTGGTFVRDYTFYEPATSGDASIYRLNSVGARFF